MGQLFHEFNKVEWKGSPVNMVSTSSHAESMCWGEWWSDKAVDENFPEQGVSVRKKQSNELVHSKSAQQGTNALETANKLLFNSEELF